MSNFQNAVLALFSQSELDILKAFYDGVPARQLRRTQGNPWPVVARYRGLEPDLHQAVKTALAAKDAGNCDVVTYKDFMSSGHFSFPVKEYDYSKPDSSLQRFRRDLQWVIASSEDNLSEPSPSWLHADLDD